MASLITSQSTGCDHSRQRAGTNQGPFSRDAKRSATANALRFASRLNNAKEQPARTIPLLGLLLALLLGVAFRLVWVQDIEFKVDEAWMHELVRDFFRDGRFVWLGMPSSQNLRIPGLSVWQFYPLGAIFGTEPTDLARGVQVMSLLALGGLCVFAWRGVPDDEREWWLWAVALLCVNPIVVLFQRKLWPPSAMPLGLVALIVCWWCRRKRWGALGWGMLAALAFQIHVAMLFYTAALAGATWFFDRRGTRWRWWLLGGLLGALPALPWMWYMATTPDGVGADAWQFSRLVEGKFWTHWLGESLGFGLQYWLGDDALTLLSWPVILGQPTYGLALLQAIVLLLGIAIGVRALRHGIRVDPRRQTDLLLAAVFVGFGVVLTLTCLRFYRHYLLLAFPLTSLWLARLALPPHADASEQRFGRRALLLICVANALITMATLTWLHDHAGGAQGIYGHSFASQQERGERPPVPALVGW